jgi:hypothetical protein
MHPSLDSLGRGIAGQTGTEPAKVLSLLFGRIESLLVAMEVHLAQASPDAPKKSLFEPVNGDLQAGSNEEMFVVHDAEVIVEEGPSGSL